MAPAAQTQHDGAVKPARAAAATRFVTAAVAICGNLAAQSLLKPEDILAAQGAFAASAAAPRLRCSFTALPPALDYALRFRTGYRVSFPLQQLAGPNHSLEVLLRVTPDGRQPVYLVLAGSLPPVPDEKLKGETQGAFVVGEGSYTVEALVKDDAGSACLGKRHIEAKRAANERGLDPPLPAMAVEDLHGEIPAAPAQESRRLDRLTILLQASALRPRAAKLEPEVAGMLADSLLSVCRNLPAKSVHLVVFNEEQQQVLLEKQDFTVESIGEVSAALDQLDLAIVDYRTLQNRDRADLLPALIGKEAQAGQAASAVVLLSPRGASKLDPARQPDASRMTRSRWFYLPYDPAFRLAARPMGGNDDPNIDTTVSRPGRGRGGITGGRGTRSWNPPAAARPADPVEQFFRRIMGESFTIRRPEDLASALRRISSEMGLSRGL